MKKLGRLWHWYVRGGIPGSASISQLRKLQFINIIALIGFIVCLPFGFFDMPNYRLVGTIELISGAIFLCSGLVLRFWRRPRLATNLIILATFLLTVMLAATGGGDGAGIVWVLVFPPLLFFLEDWKASFTWVGLLLATLAGLFFSGHLYHGYDSIFYQHTSYSIIVISIVVYFYQDINRQAERINEQAKRELFEGNQKLHQANAALASAKADVEKQVVERTQSLVKEHARLDASVSSLPLGFILTDQNLFVANINIEARQILDGDSASPDKESYSDIMRDELKLGKAIREVMDDKKRVDIGELVYRERILQITLAPIILSEGAEVIGAIVLLEDVTEKKIISRARDEFFLVASHELRTPLTIVEGNISIIKENFLADIKNAELHHMVDNAYDSTKRLIYIVNQLLQVSALELGEVSLRPQVASLTNLVEITLDKYRPAAQSKHLEISLHLSSDKNVKVNLDAERFDQVLGSLIDNAVRNTSNGSVKVDITMDLGRAKIAVTDTGRGINAANQALLFHKFHQAGSDILTREEGQSIGLGLYLAKLLVEKMKGKVYLQQSTAGKGSTFVLEVPVVKD